MPGDGVNQRAVESGGENGSPVCTRFELAKGAQDNFRMRRDPGATGEYHVTNKRIQVR
jgi:hypothetical protein